MKNKAREKKKKGNQKKQNMVFLPSCTQLHKKQDSSSRGAKMNRLWTNNRPVLLKKGKKNQ